MVPKLREIAFEEGELSKSVIINVASSAAVYPCPLTGIYSSSKHLVDIYSRTLSV